MRIRIVPTNSTITLAHRFDSPGYRTYWQENWIHFIKPSSVLFVVGRREQNTDKRAS
jgi:hypothetical protein